MPEWTEEQRELRAMVSSLGPALNDGSIEREAGGEFPRQQWDILAHAGLFGLHFDEEYGGLGQDLLTTMYVLEGLGGASRDSGLAFSAVTSIASTGVPLRDFGSDKLKVEYLPGICSGSLIGAHAITESESGSDALTMRTTARRDGEGWVLNGSKTFVTNGPVADVVVIYARTSAKAGPLGVTAFLVPVETPGFTVGKPMAKMGLGTSPMCELFLNDVRVPAGNVVGRVGGGFLVLDHVMEREILFSFIVNVGEMRQRLGRTMEYAKSRVQFGQPISSYQAISHRLVDMMINLETASKWLYDAAALVAAGKRATTEIAVAKLLASRYNLESSLSAVQIHGGNGYMSEFGIEQELRNAVAGSIYSGTNDIQYNRIASMMGL